MNKVTIMLAHAKIILVNNVVNLFTSIRLSMVNSLVKTSGSVGMLLQ